MKVGCIRHSENINEIIVQQLFAFTGLYNIDFFFFTKDSVDIDKKIIKGLFWDKKSSKYLEKDTAYPDIIEDERAIWKSSPLCIKLAKELRQYSLFTYVALRGKKGVINILEQNGFSRYLIATYEYGEIDIDKLLGKHNEVIIKPNNATHGTGVHKLSKNGNLYFLHTKLCRQDIQIENFKAEYAGEFKKARYLVQSYINSVTNAGNPFDIRIDLRRGKNGKWIFISAHARIGNKEGIVSNLAQGGVAAYDVQTFLKSEFNGDHERIYDELLYLAKKLPDVIQSGYDNTITSLGFDVGINRANSNELKIFEVNSSPGGATLSLDVAQAKVQCYNYLYENIDKLMDIQRNTYFRSGI